MKKIIVFLSLFLFAPFKIVAESSFLGFGEYIVEKGSNTYDAVAEKFATKKGSKLIDGGDIRKKQVGDRSKHQGYIHYSRHIATYCINLRVTPHQDASPVTEGENNCLQYEYRLNPYISVSAKISKTAFKGFESGEKYKTTTVLGIAEFRKYFFDHLFGKVGLGFGKMKMDKEWINQENNKEKKGLNSNLIQSFHFSVNHVIGDEDVILGIGYENIEAHSGKTNLGRTALSLNFSAGFGKGGN